MGSISAILTDPASIIRSIGVPWHSILSLDMAVHVVHHHSSSNSKQPASSCSEIQSAIEPLFPFERAMFLSSRVSRVSTWLASTRWSRSNETCRSRKHIVFFRESDRKNIGLVHVLSLKKNRKSFCANNGDSVGFAVDCHLGFVGIG